MQNNAPDAIKAVTFGQRTFCKFLSANDTDPKQSHHLENPRDRGAWWAVVYGVAQSRTRLK